MIDAKPGIQSRLRNKQPSLMLYPDISSYEELPSPLFQLTYTVNCGATSGASSSIIFSFLVGGFSLYICTVTERYRRLDDRVVLGIAFLIDGLFGLLDDRVVLGIGLARVAFGAAFFGTAFFAVALLDAAFDCESFALDLMAYPRVVGFGELGIVFSLCWGVQNVLRVL